MRTLSMIYYSKINYLIYLFLSILNLTRDANFVWFWILIISELFNVRCFIVPTAINLTQIVDLSMQSSFKSIYMIKK